MNLHEYQAKSLLAGMGMPCPKEIAIQQISQLADAWQHIACPSKGAVLKAQVHAGGRGKAGGVKVLKQLPEAQAFVQQMLGSQLVTYQTGPEGQYVSSILLCENIYPVRQELYFGMVVDRESQRVTFIVSPEGGVEIEKVAHETPEKISSVSIDPLTGVQPCHIREMFAVLQLEHGLFAAFSRLVNQAWKAFNELDFALLEINPLVLRETGEFMCADAKVSLDDNALYRHPEPVCYVMKPRKIHAKARQRSLILIMSRWTEISAAWSMVQGWLWQPWTSSSYTVNNPQTSWMLAVAQPRSASVKPFG